ncbi:hypothetical protein UG55_1006141 [Frankia sp. EI5c]|uniref:AAA family ATPase n=1 Tax=Frankia sp. EI5c TaxID=683316 RepID=UPI0007C20C65|nr:AAA family ATPase [Frankia sp. EI5c]OAA28168.1 hypothetical protein UG55_1006141 [Frankia sp. EI5c]
MPVEQVAAMTVPAEVWARPAGGGQAAGGGHVTCGGPTAGGGQVVETDAALLYLSGDRVLKRRRPVDPDDPGFHGRLSRLAACRAEVRRNRPLAPGVYLGVADVVDDSGAPRDHAVVMRRLPAGRQLAVLVRRGDRLEAPLRAIARAVAAFHAELGPSSRCADGGGDGPELTARRWDAVLAAAEPFRGTVLDTEVVGEIGRLARAYLAGRGGLLATRARDGWIRGGHGALRAEGIYCLDDGPRILGRLGGDGWHGDVLGDIALLAVDLERLGVPEDAESLVREYRACVAGGHPRSLEHLHIAYQALVDAVAAAGAAVAGTAGPESARRAGEQARRLADISYRRLRRARVRLVLVGGLPGTGKSTLAGRLAAGDDGRVLIRSDLVRAKFTVDVPGSDNSYVWPLASETTARTYTELLARARAGLERGDTVIIDASWSDGRHRAAAARLARDTSSELIELRCVTSPEVAAARLARRDAAERGVSPGEGLRATADTAGTTSVVHRAMSAWAEPWPTARVIQTAVPEGEAFHAAERCIV